MSRLMSVGVVGGVIGVGVVLGGGPGLGLLFLILGYPGYWFVQEQRRSWRLTASGERCPAANDPAMGRTFRSHGTFVLLTAMVPVAVAVSMEAAVFGYTRGQGLGVGPTLAFLLFASLFAVLPLALGVNIVHGAVQIIRGVIQGADTAKRAIWISSGFAAMIALAALIAAAHGWDTTMWMVGTAVASLVGLSANLALMSLLRHVRTINLATAGVTAAGSACSPGGPDIRESA